MRVVYSPESRDESECHGNPPQHVHLGGVREPGSVPGVGEPRGDSGGGVVWGTEGHRLWGTRKRGRGVLKNLHSIIHSLLDVEILSQVSY